MQFQDELAGGVVLIRPALQSPDYVTNVSGWAIKIDGSAEFNNVVIRGSGTADPLVVGPAGAPQVILRTTATNGLVVFPTNQPIEQDAATLNSAVIDSGAAAERAELQMTGPTVTGAGDGVRVVLKSQADDGSSTAEFSVQDRAGVNTFLAVDDTEVRIVHLPLDSRQLAAGSVVLSGYVTTDVADRVQILASGEIQWGPGSAARDVRLYREAASVLATDDILRVYRTLTTENALSIRVDGDTTSRMFVNADGNINWGAGAGAATDVNLFRQGPGELKTNNDFTADGDLLLGGSANVLGSVTAGNERHGLAATPAPGAGGGTSTVAVVFAQAMPATPRVTITPVTTVDPDPTTGVTIIGYVDAVSTTGFTIRAYRSTNSSTNWSYNAHSD